MSTSARAWPEGLKNSNPDARVASKRCFFIIAPVAAFLCTNKKAGCWKKECRIETYIPEVLMANGNKIPKTLISDFSSSIRFFV
ncbi:hypothetical protein [Chlorobaculum thiosulfatiphilum]|jgi:hypothetical protein|uniref:hypothetical protein n=1 Tax=Chlorobaculum thiosulfatiphilum TaxID=115852 RepID=UPI0014774F73|nr:hypothetical protein [Chlorobaculum thiosulfatiphilum]